jgi:hypothetical protein
MYTHTNKMPIISQTKKIGRSVDSGDLLTERKRNLLNQVNDSKKTLGIFKENSLSRGFDLVNLRAQKGLDSYLAPARPLDPLNPLNPLAIPGPFLPPGSQVPFSSPSNTPTSLDLFKTQPDGAGGAYSATYANGIWVIGGMATASVPYDFYYGPSLTNLLPLNLFGTGLYATYGPLFYPKFVTYANGTWVFGGQDTNNLGYNICYGSSPSNLRALSIFGKGNLAIASFATYANGIWVIGGNDQSGSNYHIHYGPDLDNLRPLAIFGSSGLANDAAYINGTWVIGGYDPLTENNVYYGPNLTSLLPLRILGSCTTIKFENNTWLLGGYAGLSTGIPFPAYYYGSSLTSLIPQPFLAINDNASLTTAIYSNNIWVLGFNTNSINNVYYGSDLGNLTPLPLFGVGGFCKTIIYANGIWAIGGVGGANPSIYYGANITSLTPKITPLGFFITYENGLWVAGGSNMSGNSLIYGPDLATL